MPRLTFDQKLTAHRANRLNQTFGQTNIPLQSYDDLKNETLFPLQCQIPAENGQTIFIACVLYRSFLFHLARVHIYENSCKTLDITIDWQIRGFLPYDIINIADRSFSFNDFRAFATALQSNLESLTLHAVNLTSSSLCVLCQGLIKCVRLNLLDLSDNKLGKRGFDALVATLNELTSLRYLSLANCEIQDSYGYKIGDICRHPSLVEVNLAGNKFEENACIFIGNALSKEI